jgi:hypothetical protein
MRTLRARLPHSRKGRSLTPPAERRSGCCIPPDPATRQGTRFRTATSISSDVSSVLLRAELRALTGARARPCPHRGEAIERCPRRGCICCAAPTARFTRVGRPISSADLRGIEPGAQVATQPAGCPSSSRCDTDVRPHRCALRGGTRQTPVACRRARVAQRRSGDRNDQRWGRTSGHIDGGGARLLNRVRSIAHGWRVHAERSKPSARRGCAIGRCSFAGGVGCEVGWDDRGRGGFWVGGVGFAGVAGAQRDDCGGEHEDA